MKKQRSIPSNKSKVAQPNEECPPELSPVDIGASTSGVPETGSSNGAVADASNIGAKESRGAESKQDSKRTSFEKLVKPQNYHEYMRASKFRGHR